MRIGFQLVLAAAVALPLAQVPAGAQEPASSFTNAPAPDKVGYAIGMSIGKSLKRQYLESINLDEMMNGIRDVLADRPLKLTDQQANEAVPAYERERMRVIAEKNEKEATAFLASNKAKQGIQTLSVTMPDGTTAEMQYKILAKGTGEMAKSNDVVTVNYTSTLFNGKELAGNLYVHGDHTQFPIARMPIRGVSEALKMMDIGSKWELYLPPALAFQDRGEPRSGVQPGSGVIYQIELVSAAPQQAPPPPQPMTSDIIRVPSADEMKRGSNIQVLKPEDVERMTRTNHAGGK